MEQIVIYLLMVQKLLNSRIKDSEIVATPLCLGNITKKISEGNTKKTGLNGYVYDLVLIMMLLQLMIYWIFTTI